MASSANDVYVQMQKIASDTQVKLQQMTDASTAKSFEYNTREAKASRDWQTQMSNTSHQREVADLKKAGLNPVLSANQGANAYTTSSASAQADNAANAVANVTSSRLSGMAGIESSNIGAKATKAAAATNAAAMKAAAAQSAAAARYAADAQLRAAQLNYDAKIYQVDKDFEIRKYTVDNQLAQNAWQFFDKFTRNTGMQEEFIRSQWKERLKNASFNQDISQSIAKFTATGVLNTSKQVFSQLNRTLTELQIPKRQENRNLLFRAMFMKDKQAQQYLFNYWKYSQNRHNMNLGRAVNIQRLW